MRRGCDTYEDAIWQHVKFGDHLPQEAARHAETCPECAAALAQSGRMAALLEASVAVPEAPDCRAAVMTRISIPGRSRTVLAYAWAAVVVLVAVVGAILLMNRPETGPRETVRRQAPAPRERVPVVVRESPPEKPMPEVVPEPERQPQLVERPQPPRKVVRRQPRRVPRVEVVKDVKKPPVAPEPEPEPAPDVVEDTVVVESPAAAAEDEWPVAITVVTWPAVQDPSELSYSYTERDPDTGTTTKCIVQRSGGSVSIYLESTPGGEAPPVKGSIDDEVEISA